MRTWLVWGRLAGGAGACGPAGARLPACGSHPPAPPLRTAVPLAAAKLGLRYADGSLRGGNARVVAMLQMFVQVIQVGRRAALGGAAAGRAAAPRQRMHACILRARPPLEPAPTAARRPLQDFRTPPGREFAKEFGPALNNIINFLVGAGALEPCLKAGDVVAGRTRARPLAPSARLRHAGRMRSHAGRRMPAACRMPTGAHPLPPPPPTHCARWRAARWRCPWATPSSV